MKLHAYDLFELNNDLSFIKLSKFATSYRTKLMNKDG